MFTVTIIGENLNGVFSARSVACHKKQDGKQYVTLVDESSVPHDYPIEGARDIWVMNEVGQTVSHYRIDNASNQNVVAD